MVERGRAAGEGKVVGQGESRGRIAGGRWDLPMVAFFDCCVQSAISLMK